MSGSPPSSCACKQDGTHILLAENGQKRSVFVRPDPASPLAGSIMLKLLTPERIGRLLLVALPAILFSLPYLLSVTVSPHLYNALWSWYGVPPMLPPFADLRGVTAPLECFFDKGLSLYEMNPCDPWHRPYNYPRIWFLLAYLGVGQGHTVAIGLLLVIGFLVAVSCLASLQGWRGICFMLPLVMSPPVALLVERGNNDLVIFLLLFLAGLFLHRKGRAKWLSDLFLLFAAFLKLYPFFSFVVLFQRWSWKNVFRVGVLSALFGVYLFIFSEDLARIDNATVSPTKLAFGGHILFEQLLSPEYALPMMWGIFVFLVLSGVALGWYLGTRKSLDMSPALTYFQIGGALFLGIFVLDSHYSYRLVFLLFCCPLAAALTRKEQYSLKILGVVLWCGLIGQLWLEYFPFSAELMLDEWVNWGMCGVMSLVLGMIWATMNRARVEVA